MKTFSKIFETLIIAIAIVIATVGSVTIWAKHKEQSISSISATGSASMDFDADMAAYKAGFKEQGIDYKSTYEKMKKSHDAISRYLKDKGVDEKDITFNSIEVSERTKNIYDEKGNFIDTEFLGYTMSQTLNIALTDIDKLELVERNANELLEEDVYLDKYSFKYFCQDIDSVKMNLIEKATENAKERIDIMAKKAGGKVGTLRRSNLGVFQIVAKNSGTQDFSYDGYNDVSSRHKTASITVKLEYDVK